MAEQLVVIGGGVAGTMAAEVARSLNPEASITIISAERERLYSRVLLPKYCEGKIPREKVFLKKPEWYAQQNIELRFDRVQHISGLEDGVLLELAASALRADRVVVATGGRPKDHPLYADPRSHSLQTIADADRIILDIEKIKTSHTARKAVVIGGSFIALEFVNILHHHGFAVEVRLRGDKLFSGVLPQEMSNVVRKQLEDHGVRVLSCSADALIESDVSFIGIGTGIELEAPTMTMGREEEWIEAPPERTAMPRGPEGGVMVDGEMSPTSPEASLGVDPTSSAFASEKDRELRPDFVRGEDMRERVRVAGDCAEFYDTLAGRAHVAGNWLNAQMQGRYVGAWLGGKPITGPYTCHTSYSINALGLDIVSLNDARIHVPGTEVRVVAQNTGFAVECWRNERLVGVTLVGANQTRAMYAKQLSQGVE